MWIYIPAIIALLIKILIVLKREHLIMNARLSVPFWMMLAVLAIINLIELQGYYYSGDFTKWAQLLTTGLRIYYVCLFCVLGLLLEISIVLAFGRSPIWVKLISGSIEVLMIMLVCFTDFLIQGAQSIGYSVTRIPGDYFVVGQIVAMATLLGSILVCCYGYIIAPTHYARVQCVYVILSVVALALPIFLALLAMALDIAVNSTIILPIGSTLFLITMAYALNTRGIYDVCVWIPGTTMFKLFVAVHKEFVVYPDGSGMTAKERLLLNEKRFLTEALMRSNGNQTEAARSLNISQSALSIKRKFHRI